jgi:hypothetical protein
MFSNLIGKLSASAKQLIDTVSGKTKELTQEQIFNQILADGVLSEEEIASVKARLSKEGVPGTLEYEQVFLALLRKTLELAGKDGKITQNEHDSIKQLQTLLNLSDPDLNTIKFEYYYDLYDTICSDFKVTAEELKMLESLRTDLQFKDPHHLLTNRLDAIVNDVRQRLEKATQPS